MSNPTITIKYLYDESFREGEVEWMPRRAALEVRVDASDHAACPWRTMELDLATGPDEIYRYYPFAVFISVDGRLEVILEFSGPFQKETAHLRVPVGRDVRIAVVTEGSVPHPVGNDKRTLALICGGLRLGDTVPAPSLPSSEGTQGEDHYRHNLVPLVERFPHPIFVVGSYRSGTSILTWALGQHPNILPIEETGWLSLLGAGALAGQRHAYAAKRSYFQLCDVSVEEYMAHIGVSIDDFMRKSSLRLAHHILLGRLSGKSEGDERFQIARSAYNPKRRWVDGTPENACGISLLRMLFPAARFIVMVRDPLDVVASMVRFDRAGGAVVTPEEAVAMWMQKTEAAFVAWRAFGPNVLKIVRYEQMIASPAASLQDIFDFIEEPRFPMAAWTFGERINSSQVNLEERETVRRVFAATPAGVEALALHEEILTSLERPWQYDQRAEEEMAETQGDLVARMIATVT